MHSDEQFAVAVIGGGHAGVEAATAAARAGARVMLITHNMETIGQMSCNPAIGGVGKGHIVKEIDAMGGIMARAADAAGIHFRTLNSRKGAAVQATRAQADRALYKIAVRQMVDAQANLTVFQESVDDLLIENGRVTGVQTKLGIQIRARAVVLTAGTFLNGQMHIGPAQAAGGRAGDAPATKLAARLRELPLRVARLKTGTPPRLDGKTINYEKLTVQSGDTPRPVFSYLGDAADHPRQVNCHITATNRRAHEIIHKYLPQSPIYGDPAARAIDSPGPRYCPSIEDKVVRFADRDAHQIFLEPEGLNTTEIYPNGISTSLPYAAQVEFVRSIAGLENARITRPGYAIEYDYFDPRDLQPSLQTKCVGGLFFAGQINGTTGYEEAAGQGLIAGLNAARFAAEADPWTPSRAQAYIGVMIDDLITRGAAEPYRMFTSRAEYRLSLREDNADLRLTEIADRLGLITAAHRSNCADKQRALAAERARLRQKIVRPEAVSAAAHRILGQPLTRATTAYDLLRRPAITYAQVLELADLQPGLTDPQYVRALATEARYDGYVQHQRAEVARREARYGVPLPADLDYHSVRGLSNEARQSLQTACPQTVEIAARLPGVTPAALSLLLIHLKKTAARRAA